MQIKILFLSFMLLTLQAPALTKLPEPLNDHSYAILKAGWVAYSLLLLANEAPEEIEAAKEKTLSFAERLSFRVREHGLSIAAAWLVSSMAHAIGGVKFHIGYMHARQTLFEKIVFARLHKIEQQIGGSSADSADIVAVTQEWSKNNWG